MLKEVSVEGDALKDGVDGHDAADLGLECAKIGRDVVLKVIAGVGQEI